MDDHERNCVFSFDGHVTREFVLNVQRLHDSAADKQDVRRKLRRPRDDLLAKIVAIVDMVEMLLFVAVIADDVATITPPTRTLLQDVGGLQL